MGDSTQFHGAFCWNELRTSDREEAKLYYATSLNWNARDIEVEDIVYTIFSLKGKDVAGMMTLHPDFSPQAPFWLSYIKVDDLKSVIHSSTALGATLLSGPRILTGYGSYAVLKDPIGANLAFWQKSDE